MKSCIAILAASAAALVAGSASADIIFNDGPTDGNDNAFYIDGPIGGGISDQSIYNTFTAASGGPVNELQFGLWVPTGETLTTVEWWLGTSGLNGSFGGGTVALNSGNSTLLISDNAFGFDVYEVTLTGLTSSTLTKGDSYVLTLGNGNDSGDDHHVAWDIPFGGGGGPASCGFIQSGTDFGNCGLGGEAFTLSTNAPEPAAWALMLAGFAGLGAALRSARRRAAPLGA